MEKQNGWLGKKLVAVALGFALLGAMTGMEMIASKATAENLSALVSQASTADDLESPFKAVYNEVSMSTVGIQLNTERRSLNGRILSDNAFVGSGVVISGEGHVVTNYHVVSAGGAQVSPGISVIYEDESYSAEYVAGDEEHDIAVLKVEGLPAPAVRLGNSDELSVGDWALVVGNPLGEEFTNTLSVGVISGLDRDVSGSNRQNTFIQTDAAINSGNSGGGLFNIRGELIGITSMKLSSSGIWGIATIEGIGFAIPVNTVTRIADDLIDYGAVQYPRMGVEIQTIHSASEEPTKDSLPMSVWVVNVEKGSPADVAGMQPDDLIMKADGQRVRSSEELQAVVRSHEVGESVEIEVLRIPNLSKIGVDEEIPAGETLTFEVQLEMLDQ